jgi:hypothetical protein
MAICSRQRQPWLLVLLSRLLLSWTMLDEGSQLSSLFIALEQTMTLLLLQLQL